MPNNYVLLDRIELNNTAASVTFDNIPQTGYTDLKLVVSARSTATPGVPDDGLFLQVNAITSGYSNRTLYGNGSSALSASNSYGITSKTYISALTTANATANTFGNTEVYIPNYAGSTNKSMSIDGVIENNATSAIANLTAALLSNTAAITALTLTPNSGSFVQYSTFSLYGLAQVGTTPAIAPKADGGNVIGTDGTYWYHAFLSNGTFTPQVGLSADVLVVAGGGGGGAGGGGAGGLTAFTSQSLSTTGYACTVGAGGAGSTGSADGALGGDSQFGALTLIKGGGWGSWTAATPTTGGSGGGAAANTTNYGLGTSGQGNNGGPGIVTNASPYPAGGGGGAGTAGVTPANSSSHGNGGAGVNTYSSWGSATGTGVSGYFAGGGGGGYSSGTAGTGGSGGGGNGGSGVIGSNGTTNTGGGGGGGALNPPGSGQHGGAGGSGIIIVRYLVA
jgi:hypothetical protein